MALAYLTSFDARLSLEGTGIGTGAFFLVKKRQGLSRSSPSTPPPIANGFTPIDLIFLMSLTLLVTALGPRTAVWT